MSSGYPNIDKGRPDSLPPAFSSRETCRAWLKAQAGDDPHELQVALERQLQRLNDHRIDMAERLAMLELLREPVYTALTQSRRVFTDRPLPLKAIEQDALDSSLATWSALATGYLQCLDACVGREAGAAGHLAMAAQRALSTLVEMQMDCYRGGHHAAAGHWHNLHRAYAAAESAGVAQEAVADTLRHGRRPATPLGAWAEGLLLQLAHLHEMPGRQLNWVAHWARRWSGKMAVGGDLPPTDRAIPLHVDIDSDQPAGYRPGARPNQRILDTTQLKHSLKKRLLLLERGQSPAELGLGEDCPPDQARELLGQMYFRWCKGGATRRHERRNAEGGCMVIGGIEAAHFHISGGKPAGQTEVTLSDSEIRRQREEIAVFGRILAGTETDDRSRPRQSEATAAVERWRLVDHSATGLRLLRPADHPGRRFVSKQLVAIRAPDMKAFHLGTVRRATIDSEGALHAGVRILAGEPTPLTVCGTGLNAIRNKSAPAFLLPAIAALAEPASVILPSGWFRQDRVLEVLHGQARRIRLTGLIERGSDYERATYDTLPPIGERA